MQMINTAGAQTPTPTAMRGVLFGLDDIVGPAVVCVDTAVNAGFGKKTMNAWEASYSITIFS